MRIAHNLIIDHFRKSNRIPVIDKGKSDDFDIFDNLNIMDESIEDRIITEQIHKDVRKLIDLLPAEQREVLYMRHYAEMSFKEIAEVTEVSINTALGRMRYALINLRKLIAEKNIVLTH
jgi:RNA polymerase sigma-70 factor (ECF subfamily)